MKKLIFLIIIFINAKLSFAQFGQQWLQTYDATYHNDDGNTVITLDAAGNVIISGSSYTTGQLTSEIMTIKYDPSGNVLWQMPYVNGDYAYPADIITDADRNIFIACDVYDIASGEFNIHVLKYSCAGSLAWDSIFPLPDIYNNSKRIALDNSGNVYVGATVGCPLCYQNVSLISEAAIIKFDSSGNYITAMRTGQFFPGSGTLWDYHNLLIDMDIATSSKIYSITNIAQDSSLIWPSVIMNDYALSKHDTSGTRYYLQRIPRPAKQDFPNGLFIGSNEDIFITGWTKDTVANSKESYLITKLDSAGNILYITERGNAAWISKGVGVVADASGYAYVTGFTFQNGATPDIELIKYDPNGNEVWVETYNSTFNNWDEPYSIHIDVQANLYISARSKNASNFDWLILKYDSAGIFQWEQRYNGTSNQEEEGPAIVLNALSEIFATGATQGANGYDFVTIKYGYPTTVTGDSLCTTVGINELNIEELSFSVYPNPTNSDLTIRSSKNIKEIKIIDVLGNVIMQKGISNSTNMHQASVTDFSAGIYIVQLTTENRVFIQRFIKL